MNDIYDILKLSKEKTKRQRDNWKARAVEMHKAISIFVKESKNEPDIWKNQPHIKRLFDIITSKQKLYQ